MLKDLDVTEEYEIGAQNDYTDFLFKHGLKSHCLCIVIMTT